MSSPDDQMAPHRQAKEICSTPSPSCGLHSIATVSGSSAKAWNSLMAGELSPALGSFLLTMGTRTLPDDIDWLRILGSIVLVQGTVGLERISDLVARTVSACS